VPKHYTVSDGEFVLFLWPAEEGGYTVTSPLDPDLITQAENVEEAFVMARDVWELLKSARSEEGRPASKLVPQSKSPLGRPRKRRTSLK
jgi:predicted RNase H-like HicB family nuclease